MRSTSVRLIGLLVNRLILPKMAWKSGPFLPAADPETDADPSDYARDMHLQVWFGRPLFFPPTDQQDFSTQFLDETESISVPRRVQGDKGDRWQSTEATPVDLYARQ